MEKDYLQIVLDGIGNPNNRNHLVKYFKRQMKFAESEFYDNEEFTNGCLGIIKAFENNLNSQLQKEKHPFYKILDYYKSLDSEKIEVSGKLVDRLSRIEFIENHISSLNINNFSVNLHSVTNGKFTGHLWNNEIEEIKTAIILACVNSEIDSLIEKSETKFTAFQWAIIFHYDFIYNNKSESNIKKKAIELFINKYKATTTFNRISNLESTIKKSIKINDINIKEFELVKLFIKDNFDESIFDAIEYDIVNNKDEQSRK